MASKIKGGEWTLLYLATGALDIVQFVIDFTGVGEIINEIADIVIGVILAIYFQLRGVSLVSHMDRLLSLVGVTALEELSFGVAPAWILDVWYIRSSVKKEEAALEVAEQEEESLNQDMRQPLNQDGVRAPRNEELNASPEPANVDGIRPPGGGLVTSE